MLDFEIVDLEPQPAVVVYGNVPLNELPEFFGRAFMAVMKELESHDAVPTGPPFGFYPSMPNDLVEVRAGFPASAPVEPGGEVEAFELPGCRAVRTMHVGPYEALENTYNELLAWMQTKGLTPTSMMWEYYLSGPEVPPEETRTEIVCPIAE